MKIDNFKSITTPEGAAITVWKDQDKRREYNVSRGFVGNDTPVIASFKTQTQACQWASNFIESGDYKEKVNLTNSS